MKTFEQFIDEHYAGLFKAVGKEHALEEKMLFLKEVILLVDMWQKLNKHDVSLSLPDDKVEQVIFRLDEYARDYDSWEYGLPTSEERMPDMKKIVIEVLGGNAS